MTRWLPLIALVFGALAFAGCDEDCIVGECFSFEQCEEECIEVCEGEVIEAFCTIGDVCECDCGLGCFID
ncbi:MAG: hypothetical protein AAGF92_15570 [Myxococcota bacterium]